MILFNRQSVKKAQTKLFDTSLVCAFLINIFGVNLIGKNTHKYTNREFQNLIFCWLPIGYDHSDSCDPALLIDRTTINYDSPLYVGQLDHFVFLYNFLLVDQ